MDRQEVTLLVLIDLSAAFNTIDHAILLETLEKDFGVTGNALKWLTSYLSKRKQTILINLKTINRKFSIFNRECRRVAVLALSSSYSTWLGYLRSSINIFPMHIRMQMTPRFIICFCRIHLYRKMLH
jgi:hypothetical protein